MTEPEKDITSLYVSLRNADGGSFTPVDIDVSDFGVNKRAELGVQAPGRQLEGRPVEQI